MGKYTDPDWEHSALVTIDTQNDFTLPGAPSEIAGTVDVLAALWSLVGAFRAAGRPIFHVVRLY
jgi:nicotinamidase-related amidase